MKTNTAKKVETTTGATVEAVREFDTATVEAIEQAHAINNAIAAANHVSEALAGLEGATVKLSDSLIEYVKSDAYGLPVADAVATLTGALADDNRPRGTVSGYGTQVKAVLTAMHATGNDDASTAYILVAASADVKPSAFASVAKAYKADGTLKSATNNAGNAGKEKTEKASASEPLDTEADAVHDAETQTYTDREQCVFDALNSGNDRALLNAAVRLLKHNGMDKEVAAKLFASAWNNG